jgi:WD40 repeat protein
VLTRNDGTASGDDPYLVASASSNGIIRVWDVRMAEADTKSRLTCLAGSSIKCESNKSTLIINREIAVLSAKPRLTFLIYVA